jgi:uncharacterized Zn finger protein
MALSEDRIVLAVECSRCQQLTSVPVYNGMRHIARCGACGHVYNAVEVLSSRTKVF